MLSKLQSIELQRIESVKHILIFNREAIPDSEEISLSFAFQLSLNEDNKENRCCLSMSCISFVKNTPEGEDGPFSLDLQLDYKFKILEPAIFSSMTEEERASLLSNIVYLHFRRKLVACFADAGLNNVKFPLSIDKLKSLGS